MMEIETVQRPIEVLQERLPMWAAWNSLITMGSVPQQSVLSAKYQPILHKIRCCCRNAQNYPECIASECSEIYAAVT